VIGTLVAGRGDGGIGRYAVAVDRADSQLDRAETAVDDDAAIVGDARHAIEHEVLKGQAGLTREHQVGDLKLPQHHRHTAAENIVVAEPGVLDEETAVIALLRHNAVTVEGDVLGERRTGEQLDEIGRLEVPGIVIGLFVTVGALGIIAQLGKALRTQRQRYRVGQRQALIAVIAGGRILPVTEAHILRGKLLTELVQAWKCRMAGSTAHVVLAGEHWHCQRLLQTDEHHQQSDNKRKRGTGCCRNHGKLRLLLISVHSAPHRVCAGMAISLEYSTC